MISALSSFDTVLISHILRTTKIAKQSSALLIDQDILGLNITMNYVVLMYWPNKLIAYNNK